MKTLIRVLNGATAGLEFVLDEPVVNCGRVINNDLVIADNNASRHHCRFVAIEGEPSYRLEDVGSSNGTYVNDVLIQSKVLVAGDQICIGSTQLEVATVENPSESSLDSLSNPPPDPEMALGTAKPARDIVVEIHGTAAAEELTAAVSHRINNLLHLNSGGEFLIDSGLKSENLEQVSQGWNTSRRTQNRINQLLKNMLTCSRTFNPVLGERHLHSLVEAAASQIGDMFDATRLEIKHNPDSNLTLTLDDHYTASAIENILAVGLMASADGENEQNKVTLETAISDDCVVIRVSFQHFDDRFSLDQLTGDRVNKDNAEFGMIEMLASRKIVAAQNGTIEFFTEAESLNSIEVRFPIGAEIKT